MMVVQVLVVVMVFVLHVELRCSVQSGRRVLLLLDVKLWRRLGWRIIVAGMQLNGLQLLRFDRQSDRGVRIGRQVIVANALLGNVNAAALRFFGSLIG